MTVETATYISDLNATYPASGDQRSEGDNHMRLIKGVLRNSFPNISGAVSPTHLELNYVAGVTSAIQDQINRTLRQSGGSALSAIPDAATRASKVLGFDSSGNPVTIIANTDLAAAVTAAGNAATSETNAAASAVAAAASAASVDAAAIAASIATKATGPASATDNAIARFDATTGKRLQNSTVTVSDTGDIAGIASLNGGQLAGLRNKIINGNFGINQRGYVSGAATTAGQYTFDRWKVTGTGGITFSTTSNKTTITIPSGQTFQQVIEGLNLETGTYVLSWGGTAQGRINGGSYGASGAVTASLTGGTDATIEFNAGTVERVQLEVGSVATPFEHRPYGLELALCQRYFYSHVAYAYSSYFLAPAISSTRLLGYACNVPVPMRVLPTSTMVGTPYVYSTSLSTVGPLTAMSFYQLIGTTLTLDMSVSSGLTVGQVYLIGINGGTGFQLSSEL